MPGRIQDGGWLWGSPGGRFARASQALPSGFTQADADALMAALRAKGLEPTPLRAPGSSSGSRPPTDQDPPPDGTPPPSDQGGGAADDLLAGAGLGGSDDEGADGVLGQGGSQPGSRTPPERQPTGRTSPGRRGADGPMPWEPGVRVDVPDYLEEVPYWGAIMFPPDPAYAAFRAGTGQDTLAATREDLLERYPIGTQLADGDPWHHVFDVGGKEVHFYDAQGRFGKDRSWLWWKDGVGWVDLLEEQPPGFDRRLLDAYRDSRKQQIDPVVGRSTRGVGGRAVTQNVFGGGWVDPDGTRVMRGGYDRYADGTTVFYSAVLWSPEKQQWIYRDLRGRMPDGREWRADWAWYEGSGSSRAPRFTTGGKSGVEWVRGGSGSPGPAPRPDGTDPGSTTGADPGSGKAD